MINVNRIGDKVSGSVNGVPFSVSYSEEKFALMKELSDKAKQAKTIEELKWLVEQFQILTRENYADFVEGASPYIKVNKNTNRFYLHYNGVISDKVMPDRLAQRIIRSVEKSADILPLVKFWVRFLHNPNYTDSKANLLVDYIESTYTNHEQVQGLVKWRGLSEVMAIEFSTTFQVSITVEGLMVGYKSSYEITETIGKALPENVKKFPEVPYKIDDNTGLVVYDDTKYDELRIFEPANQHQNGDAFYSGSYLGHIIRVGQVHYLPHWHQVNCYDGTSGVKGLHIGGLKYIKTYQGRGTVTHNILVDPMHIGAIVGLGDGDDGAMRVKQYFVLNAFNGVNKNLYHSSTYARKTDAEYFRMIEDASKGKLLEY